MTTPASETVVWRMTSASGHDVTCAIRDADWSVELWLRFSQAGPIHQTFTSRTEALIHATRVGSELAEHGWRQCERSDGVAVLS